MGTQIPVNSLFDYLEMMLRDEWGYIWGTAGELWTASKQKALESKYSADDPNRGMSVRYGSRWIDHMVADCSGIPVYIWKQFGKTIPHGSSSMVRNSYIVDCGPTPHPGWAALVDPTPDTPDNKHIGIVGRDGKTVYECKGTLTGFTTSLVTDSRWSKFGRFPDVDYGSEEVTPMPDTGKQVSYKAEVTTNQGKLNLRTGPGTGNSIITGIPKGKIVNVKIEFPNGWRFVTYNNLQGYVSGSYLTPIEEDEPSVPEPGDPALTDYTALQRSDGIRIKLEGFWEIVKG